MEGPLALAHWRVVVRRRQTLLCLSRAACATTTRLAPEAFVEAEIYLASHLERLTTFFVEAADVRMGVLAWID